MSKTQTPKAILFTVAFLALYCGIMVLFSWQRGSWITATLAVVAGIGCVGAAAMRGWSRYFIYALSAVFATSWLHSIYSSARAGYYWPLGWPDIIVSMLPDMALLAIACYCSLMTHRHLGQGMRLSSPSTLVESKSAAELLP